MARVVFFFAARSATPGSAIKQATVPPKRVISFFGSPPGHVGVRENPTPLCNGSHAFFHCMIPEPDGLQIVKIRRRVNHPPDNGPMDLIQAVVSCFLFNNLKTQLLDFLCFIFFPTL